MIGNMRSFADDGCSLTRGDRCAEPVRLTAFSSARRRFGVKFGHMKLPLRAVEG